MKLSIRSRKLKHYDRIINIINRQPTGEISSISTHRRGTLEANKKIKISSRVDMRPMNKTAAKLMTDDASKEY